MTDKGFNLFDEYAAICVHLSPQEEERTIYLLFKIVINLRIFENRLENAYEEVICLKNCQMRRY